MAELVQRHMEAMAEEIEEMRRTKLYTFDETRLILQKRKEFEYKINGITKTLQDFRDYILYEKVLIRHIKNRRENNNIKGKESGIEHKIMRRIKNLYEIALQRFANDFEMSLSYFKFCKQSNYINAATIAVENMIKNYSHNSEVWQIAAGWYAYERKDLNSALKILRKGLTLHKNCPQLYIEALKMELSVGTKENEPVLCEKFNTYIKSICTNIPDFHCLIQVLDLLEQYDFTQNIQMVLIEKLKTFENEELVWHTLAQREIKGIHCHQDHTTKKKSLTLCFEMYENGLKSISVDEKRKQLLFMYLDCLLELWRKRIDSTICDKLKDVLNEADKQNGLNEKYYIAWLELVNDKEAAEIVKKGTHQLPDSVQLWKLRLRCAFDTENITLINKEFFLGIQALKNRALPLWLMILQFHMVISRKDVIESIYIDAIKQPIEISQVFKPNYIEWLALNGDMEEARTAYHNIANEEPFCKELHLMMSTLESTDMNMKEWVKVHELACKQFGHEDMDVWINHILFYLRYNVQQVQKIEKIRQQAEKTLPDLLLADFKEKYNNILNEFK